METEAELGDNLLGSSISIRRRSASVSDDYSVQKTNDDATESKFSAVKAGYWNDSYIHNFILNPENVHRRAPEILRGYWARYAAFELALGRVLQVAGADLQIISLGSGFDTLYYRLKEKNTQFRTLVEVDFSSVTSRKIKVMRKIESLHAHFPGLVFESQHSDLHAGEYHLVGADLRQKEELWHKLEQTGLDPTKPTVVLAECVLVYMEPHISQQLISSFTERFNEVVFINYEQVNMTDRFSQVMQNNLLERGIHLVGLGPCVSLETQKARFAASGYTSVNAWTMQDLYAKHFSKEEIAKIEKLELLDEKELLSQLLEHYTLVLAIKTESGLLNDLVF